jgi:hypothetical protein
MLRGWCSVACNPQIPFLTLPKLIAPGDGADMGKTDETAFENDLRYSFLLVRMMNSLGAFDMDIYVK